MEAKEAKSIDALEVFRKYTRLPNDKRCFILDVRPVKDFKRHHLLLSYCIRLTSDGKALAEYSNNLYDIRWSQQVWWNCDVIVIGENGLRKTHPVLKFLQDEGRVASLAYFRHGIDAFQQAYPFLVGQSLKAHRNLVYPSPVKGIKGLYLGNWKNAEDTENLKQLGITRLVTIHNDPQALKFPANTKQMAITLADLPSADLTRFFDATFIFIEESLAVGRSVLIHCGAGCSRSPAILAAFLMRRHRLGARTAIESLQSIRSSVCPNEGFWRQLCAFEKTLGLPAAQHSDPRKPPVVSEAYGGVARVVVDAGVAGGKVEVESSSRKREARAVLSRAGGKRSRDRESSPGEGDRPHNSKTTRLPDSQSGQKSSLQVLLKVQVSKQGQPVDVLTIPSLRPYQRCIFGRGPDADVKLEHASLSRAHAQLSVDRDGAVTLLDLGSAHGTNIDGAWVKAHVAKELRVGSKFRFAASSRTYCVLEINVKR